MAVVDSTCIGAERLGPQSDHDDEVYPAAVAICLEDRAAVIRSELQFSIREEQLAG
jgi:hypothetical protein